MEQTMLIVHDGENVDHVKHILCEKYGLEDTTKIWTVDKDEARQLLFSVPKNRYHTIFFSSTYNSTEFLSYIKALDMSATLVFIGTDARHESSSNVFFIEDIRTWQPLKKTG